MRAVVQRVSRASVEVDGEVVGQIEHGLCAFVGAGAGDDPQDVAYIASKIARLRIFRDDSGKMTRSVVDVGGGVLVVSQFTLFGDVRRGNRPSFTDAKEPGEASRQLDDVVALLRKEVERVATGRFGADMRVLCDNDGPVTILIDSKKQF